MCGAWEAPSRQAKAHRQPRADGRASFRGREFDGEVLWQRASTSSSRWRTSLPTAPPSHGWCALSLTRREDGHGRRSAAKGDQDRGLAGRAGAHHGQARRIDRGQTGAAPFSGPADGDGRHSRIAARALGECLRGMVGWIEKASCAFGTPTMSCRGHPWGPARRLGGGPMN